MKKVLITGGAGFIGSHIIEEIIKHKNINQIIVIDDLSTGKLENLPDDDKIIFCKGDVSDTEFVNSIFKQNNIDCIIHLAAIASVQDSIDDPVRTHNVNFDATLNLLECARKQGGVKRFIFASSAAVYGDKPDLPCIETSNINPISPYGIDKYAAERFVIAYSKLFNVPATAFRFFNVYGPRQNPFSPYSGVISIFAREFNKSVPAITIYGDGEQTRDFVYVKDLVSIILRSFDVKETIGECINICTGRGESLNNIVKSFEIIYAKKAQVTNCEERQGDIKHSCGCTKKMERYRLYNSFTDIKDGLKTIIDTN